MSPQKILFYRYLYLYLINEEYEMKVMKQK